MGFTWSDFGSSEQRKGHVKPHPDRLGPEIYQIHPRSVVKKRFIGRVGFHME
ncbi:heat-shock protein HtpX [Kroppenstedtia eburnea]|uniref:heat-shock protein HtpX n=1 Tax=Kroppenstedtia eburnea TaxID=714067 RepID=UPI001179F22C|nr:heat-shock protein HtpX [Kroppenstedtia eburnea]